MKFNVFLFPALILFQFFVCCGEVTPSSYTIITPPPPEEWVSLLGGIPPHWRLEWLDKSGNRRTADILPGKSAEIEIPVTWANPVAAWPYWPEHNVPSGFFKPAGAIFPFDVDGDRLCLSWKAGVDTVFYWELALASRQNTAKLPSNFDWPRFRELLKDETINEAVRNDPWLVNWRSVAEKTISSSFDKRRLVPEATENVSIPVCPGPWYGTSPFSKPLYFDEDEAPVFKIRPGINEWISDEGILRVSGKAWIINPLSRKLSIGYYGYN